jgi:nitronate monooxygenase
MPLEFLARVDLPVIQAPMAGSQDSALAIAVCDGGGLGSLACASLGIEAMRAQLEILATRNDLAYNLNFFCHATPAPDAAREQAWRSLLRPYYDEFGLEAAALPASASRLPFDTAMCSLLEEYRPPVVSFHFGLPCPALLARIRAWGGKVVSSATTVEEARWLEARGVDAVIAQGIEAGGHRGHFLSADLSLQSAPSPCCAG